MSFILLISLYISVFEFLPLTVVVKLMQLHGRICFFCKIPKPAYFLKLPNRRSQFLSDACRTLKFRPSRKRQTLYMAPLFQISGAPNIIFSSQELSCALNEIFFLKFFLIRIYWDGEIWISNILLKRRLQLRCFSVDFATFVTPLGWDIMR